MESRQTESTKTLFARYNMSTAPPQTNSTMSSADHSEDTIGENADQPAGPKEDLSLLIDRTPPWLRWPAASFGIAVVIGVVYWLYSVTPLASSDVWAHVAYGRWTVENGIPQTEPLMPLCEGMPMPAVDWLWDVTAYGLANTLGPQGLKFLVAGPIALALLFLAIGMYRHTWSGTWSAIALVACLWMLHKQLFIRPQMAGLMLFCAVWLIAREGRRWPSIVAIGVVFALWSNVHGSWPVGLAMLGAMTVGRGIDLVKRTRLVRSLWHDQTVRRLFYSLEVAAVAVMLNPDGWAIYPGVVAIAQDINVDALIEWAPLTLRMQQGKALVAVLVVLILLYRVSPRRVSFQEPLLLMGLAAATLHTSRYIVWLAPLVAYYLALHGAASWRRFRGRRIEMPQTKGLWAAASLGMAWIAFALAPQYRALTGTDRPGFEDLEQLRRVVSDDTPIGALKYLRENPPSGLVYNDLSFGDAMLWFGPEGIQPFVHSHAHLTPRDVWIDYFRIGDGNNALDKLNRYGAVAAVLDGRDGRDLARTMATTSDWDIVFRDSKAIVLERTSAIGAKVGNATIEGAATDETAAEDSATAENASPEPSTSTQSTSQNADD